ncbi:hypothetical protein ISS37_06445 [candidate division KSB1 bacterium]|nr:hypothetical protein [candidate division KSB1 bacterium]
MADNKFNLKNIGEGIAGAFAIAAAFLTPMFRPSKATGRCHLHANFLVAGHPPEFLGCQYNSPVPKPRDLG